MSCLIEPIVYCYSTATMVTAHTALHTIYSSKAHRGYRAWPASVTCSTPYNSRTQPDHFHQKAVLAKAVWLYAKATTYSHTYTYMILHILINTGINHDQVPIFTEVFAAASSIVHILKDHLVNPVRLWFSSPHGYSSP